MKPLIKLITFDAMNTLFTVKYPVGTIYLSTARLLFPKEAVNLTTEEDVDRAFKTAFKREYKMYSHYGHTKISSEQFWHQIICSTFENVGCDFGEAKMKTLTSTLYEDFSSANYWTLFPEVRDVLCNLKSKGVRMGVISNFDERLESLLTNLDLIEYFDFVLCSKTVGASKPDPAIFKLALEKSNVDASKALHIGDDIDMDYKAAKDVKIHGLLLSREKTVKASAETVNSLKEVFDNFQFSM